MPLIKEIEIMVWMGYGWCDMDECKAVSATLALVNQNSKVDALHSPFVIGNWEILEFGSHVGCFPYQRREQLNSMILS